VIRENGADQYYYTYTDHLGSLLTLTAPNGTVILDQNFDAWGRLRHPANWDYTNVPAPTSYLYRGFTGHEHLTNFNLINMNGRMYDPVVGRVLSVDNYVQNPYSTQAYNRYSYVMNNPLKYTDPSGQLFGTIMTFTGDLFETAFLHGGLDPTSKTAKNSAWRNFDPTAPGTRTNNAWKIDMGVFKTDPKLNFWGRAGTLISRFTWEAPQTTLGNLYSHFRNGTRKVDNVEYWHGATLVNSRRGLEWGLTLGPYINSQGMEIGDDMFRHEYGHTLQSKLHGPLYITHVGVPNFIGAILSQLGWHDHNNEWSEIQANRMSYKYLMKHHRQSLNEDVGGRSWSNEYKLDYVIDWYFILFPPSYLSLLNF
jgi:RHS repeat-associated protein